MKLAYLLLAVSLFFLPGSNPSLGQGQGSASQPLKMEELDALVAPIALYPDALLAQVLIASTYPLEVVEAERWVAQNKALKGPQLKAAADKLSWDDSIKSLTATPSALNMMSTRLDWTRKLGDAVLAQQADVMEAVQRLRTKAQANRQLQNTKEQKVTTKTENNKQVIVIAPVQPNTIYVPYYNPAVVYGPWPYPAYPPYYWAPPPGYYAGAAVATGIAFGAGFAVGAWASNNNYWGGSMGWGNNNIQINNDIDINRNRNFTHKPEHRHGVKYANNDVAQKFNKNSAANTANRNQRVDFRGHDGKPVLQPNRPSQGGGQQARLEGNRPSGPNAGTPDRPGAKSADRPAAKTSDRPGAKGADRPGGNRPQQHANINRQPPRDSGFSNVEPRRQAERASNRGREHAGNRGGGRR